MQEGLLVVSCSRSERRQRASACLLLAALLGLILTAGAWFARASVDSFGEGGGVHGSSSGGEKGGRKWWSAVWQHDVVHYTVRGSLADLAALCVLRAVLVVGLGAVGACLPPHGLTRRQQVVGWGACAACTTATIVKVVAPMLIARSGTVVHGRTVPGWCVVGLAFGWPLFEAALIANVAAAGQESMAPAAHSSRRGVDHVTHPQSRRHVHYRRRDRRTGRRHHHPHEAEQQPGVVGMGPSLIRDTSDRRKTKGYEKHTTKRKKKSQRSRTCTSHTIPASNSDVLPDGEFAHAVAPNSDREDQVDDEVGTTGVAGSGGPVVSTLRRAFQRGELTLGPVQFRALVSASWSCLLAARRGDAPSPQALRALRDCTVAVSDGAGNEVAAQLIALLDKTTSVILGDTNDGWRVDAQLVEVLCGDASLSAEIVSALSPILQRRQ